MKESTITAVILVAGQGKRLFPLTRTTPKCLLEIGGVSILSRQLAALWRNGIRRVHIVTGFHAEEIENFACKNFPELQFTFIRNPDYASTNTLYSLALAAQSVGQHAHVLQLNGDVVFHPKIIEIAVRGGRHDSFAAIIKKKCGAEEIKAVIDKDNCIIGLNKSQNPKMALGEAVGINKFGPEFWGLLHGQLLRLMKNFSAEYFEFAVEQTIKDDQAVLLPLDINELGAVEIDFFKDISTAENFVSQNVH